MNKTVTANSITLDDAMDLLVAEFQCDIAGEFPAEILRRVNEIYDNIVTLYQDSLVDRIHKYELCDDGSVKEFELMEGEVQS